MNDTAHSSASPSLAVATPIRLAAAAAVLVGGLVHLQLYFDGYRDFPNDNLGRSFLANGIASALLAAALVVRKDAVLRLAAIGVSAGTLVAFAMSRTDSGIFGFTESGLRPSPQAGLTLVSEILAIVLLAATFVPRVGPGRELELKVVAPVAVAVLAFTGVMSVLWNRAPDTPEAVVETTTATPDVSTAPGGDIAPAGGDAVEIAGFAFGPPELSVAAGTTVTWTNADSFDHTATGRDGVFDSGELAQGQSFSFTFDTAGTFAYICNIHPSMSGTVTVTP
jgi:plastocyanin